MKTVVDDQSVGRKVAREAFASGDPRKIGDALLSVAFYDTDWQWVQDQCLSYLDNESAQIRCVAAICLGHVARIHGKLDLDKVVSALRSKKEDPEVWGSALDALDDIEMFVVRKVPSRA